MKFKRKRKRLLTLDLASGNSCDVYTGLVDQVTRSVSLEFRWKFTPGAGDEKVASDTLNRWLADQTGH